MQEQTVRVCKCHGISGSCEYQTCYKSLGPFGKVGSYLLKKYHKVAKVTVNQSDNELILADKKHAKNPSHDALVFSVKSPDYCKPNSSTGSIGTLGRYCSKTTTGRGSCKVLCCGRGYNILQERRVYNCSCQFSWCCHIKCAKCSQVVETYICSWMMLFTRMLDPPEYGFPFNLGKKMRALRFNIRFRPVLVSRGDNLPYLLCSRQKVSYLVLAEASTNRSIPRPSIRYLI